LFDTLNYVNAGPSLVECTMPKLGDLAELSIISKLDSQQSTLECSLVKGIGKSMYYSRKVGYFLQVLDFKPSVLDGGGKLREPSEFKELKFKSQEMASSALCCLNSSLFYWFVTVFSDCRHLNKREVDAFPILLGGLASNKSGQVIMNLSARLMADLQKNSQTRRMTFQHDTLTVQCIIPKHSKPILDEIDRVLAEHYGFTPEELDFIINYDIKYRMGAVAGEDDS